jgi:hypothetical protein
VTTVSASTISPFVGSQVIWTVGVATKPLTGGATNVKATVTLPSQVSLDLTKANRGAGCGAAVGTTVVCDLDFIHATTPGVIELFTTVRAAGALVLTAAVTETETDVTLADNTASLTLNVPAASAPNPPAPPASAPPATPPRIAPTLPKLLAKPAGVARVGRILRAPAFTLPRGGKATFQWQRCRKGKCAAIKGATLRQLKVRKGYVGWQLRVAVSVRAAGKLSKTVSRRSAVVRA